MSETESDPKDKKCIINDLPIEILQNIFALGHVAEEDPGEAEEENVLDDDGDDEFEDVEEDEEDAIDLKSAASNPSDRPELPFSVLVSHVCVLWRTIVLGSPSLWTQLNFNEGRPFDKSKTWIERSKDAALDIHLDFSLFQPPNFAEESDEDMKADIQELAFTIEDANLILEIICPEHARWRCLSVHAPKYEYIHAITSRLATLPGAAILEELELVLEAQDPMTYDDETPFEPAALNEKFTLFKGHTPMLSSLSLWGVHINYEPPLFSHSLRSIELAYHANDVRPTFEEFAQMIHACSALQSLMLCASGPTCPVANWPLAEEVRIHSPTLESLSLAYLEPEYVGAILERLHLPKVIALDFDLPDGDYSTFAQQMATPVKHMGSTAPASFLKQIESLKVSGFPCDVAAVDLMFLQFTNLETLHINFEYVDIFWFLRLAFPIEVASMSMLPAGQLNGIDSLEAMQATLGAMQSAMMQVEKRTKAIGKATHDVYMPKLATLISNGIAGNMIRELVRIRKAYGVPLRKVLMSDLDDIDEKDELWLKENLDEGFEIYEPSDSEDDLMIDEDEDDSTMDVDMVMISDDDDGFI